MVAYGGYVGTVDEMLRACPFMRGFEDQPDLRDAVIQEGVEQYQRLEPAEAQQLHAETQRKITQAAEAIRQPQSPERVVSEVSSGSTKPKDPAPQELPKSIQLSESEALAASLTPVTEVIVPDNTPDRLAEAAAEMIARDVVQRYEADAAAVILPQPEAPVLVADAVDRAVTVLEPEPYYQRNAEVVTPQSTVVEAMNLPVPPSLEDNKYAVAPLVPEPLNDIVAEFTADDWAELPLEETEFTTVLPLELNLRDDLEADTGAVNTEELTPIMAELTEAVADFEQVAVPEEAEQLYALLAESLQIAELLAVLQESGDIEMHLGVLDAGDPTEGEAISHAPLVGMSEARIAERLTVVCEQLLTMLDMPRDEEQVRLLVGELLARASRPEQSTGMPDLSVEELERWGMHNYKLRFGHIDDAVNDISGAHIRRIGTYALAA